MIKLSQLVDKFNYPKKHKAELSMLFSDVVAYAMQHRPEDRQNRIYIRNMLNTAIAVIVHKESCNMDLSLENPADVSVLDDDYLVELLGDLYLKKSDITWDYENIESAVPISTKVSAIGALSAPAEERSTPKESLYLRPPLVPRVDPTKPWLDVVKDGERWVIYTSLPIIPTFQNEISVTTDVSKMTDSDLIKLFPNHFIRTRAAAMYESYEGLDSDPDLGVILPIPGYTREQLVKNLIEYPHFYKLKRHINDDFPSFYSQIEIDGQLYETMDVWDDLPESKVIPRTSEYIKEYVVRRYLLERDSGIEHKYPMHGSLNPFLTLFTTESQYRSYGYDPVETARSAVKSRVSFLQTRNPVIRKVYNRE